jgi:predicted RNA-binding protein with PUA-like domain
MAYWLLKTEPSTYSFDTLEKERQTRWDGVENPAALKNLRAARPGDGVVVYHTGDERAAVGIAEVIKEAYAAKTSEPKLVVIDIAARQRLAVKVSLAALKQHPAFAESPLVKQGRLSVVPLSAEQWKVIQTLGAR